MLYTFPRNWKVFSFHAFYLSGIAKGTDQSEVEKEYFVKKVLVIVVLVFVILIATVFAGDNVVELDSANIEDGQTDIPIDIAIELEFTNNVVNKNVAKDNAKCISLSSQEKEIAVVIEMADDQIEPDKKRIIRVIPTALLAKGQVYELIISGELSAKNGNKMGEDVMISFSTEGIAANSGFGYWWIIVIAAVVIVAIVIIVLSKKKRDGKE